MIKISNGAAKSVKVNKRHLVLLFFILILVFTAMLSACAGNGNISKRLQSDGFDIYIYSDVDIETREQLDEFKKAKYFVRFDLRCNNGFDECSGSFYVIDIEKSAEYYCAYYLQDYDAPSEYYYKMISGSKKDVVYFFKPEKKLNKKDGERYIKLVKDYLQKYGLDKKTLLNLGKETKYFRDYLPKRDEIKVEEEDDY